MLSLENLLAKPDEVLARDLSRSQWRKLMRMIGAHAAIRTGIDTEDTQSLHLAQRVAAAADDTCCLSYAGRLEAYLHLRRGHLAKADEAMFRVPSGCPYCVVDLNWRVVSLLRKQAFATGKTLANTLKKADLAVSSALDIEDKDRARGLQDLTQVNECVHARALMQRAITGFLMGQKDEALISFEQSLKLSSAPKGKINAYRWWGRVVPCPSMPTAQVRDNVNEAAFVNYCVGLARINNSESRAKAGELADKLLQRRQELFPGREAKLLWTKGMLKIDDWSNAKTSKERQAAREATERLLRQAMLRLIDAGALPVDIVACVCDRARLPWVVNPARVMNEILRPTGRYSVNEVKAHIQSLDPKLHRLLMSATEEGRREDVRMAIGRFRQLATRQRAWPSFFPKAV